MITYKKILKRRILVSSFVSISTVLLIIIFSFVTKPMRVVTSHIQDFITGFQFGLITGYLLVMLIFTFKCVKALRDDRKCKLLFIKEHDERTLMIQSKIGGTGLNILLIVLSVSTILAGFFNVITFITLGCVLLFTGLMKLTLKTYYSKTM